jgi:NAD+ synthase (glutamine-hydrolysing)
MATGYCTLYGDMAAALRDQGRGQDPGVRLARWRNAHDPYGTGANPIPERIITRPPSAELRPDQKDQDSLPPYEVLDAIMRALHGERCPRRSWPRALPGDVERSRA